MSESDASTVPPEGVAEDCPCASHCHPTNHNVFICNRAHDSPDRDLKSAPNSRAGKDMLTKPSASSPDAQPVLHEHELCRGRELCPPLPQIAPQTTNLPPIRYHEPQQALRLLPTSPTQRGDASCKGGKVELTCSSLPSSRIPHSKQTVETGANGPDAVTVERGFPKVRRTKTQEQLRFPARAITQMPSRRNDQPSKGLSHETTDACGINNPENVPSANIPIKDGTVRRGTVKKIFRARSNNDDDGQRIIAQRTPRTASVLPAAFFSRKKGLVKPVHRNLLAQKLLLPRTVAGGAACHHTDENNHVADISKSDNRHTLDADAKRDRTGTTVPQKATSLKQDVLSTSTAVSPTNPPTAGQEEVSVTRGGKSASVKQLGTPLSLQSGFPHALADGTRGGETADGPSSTPAAQSGVRNEDAVSRGQLSTTTPCAGDTLQTLPPETGRGSKKTKKQQPSPKKRGKDSTTLKGSAQRSTRECGHDDGAASSKKKPKAKKSGGGRKRKKTSGTDGTPKNKRVHFVKPTSAHVDEKQSANTRDEEGVSSILRQMRASCEQSVQTRSKFLVEGIQVLPKPICEDKNFREMRNGKDALKADRILLAPLGEGRTKGCEVHLPSISKELLDLTCHAGVGITENHPSGVDSGATGDQRRSCEAKRGGEESGVDDKVHADTKGKEHNTTKTIECGAPTARADSNSGGVALNEDGCGESNGKHEQRTLSCANCGGDLRRVMQLQREVQLLRALVLRKESAYVDSELANDDAQRALGEENSGTVPRTLRAMRTVRLSHILSALDVDEVPEQMDAMVTHVLDIRRREVYEQSVAEGAHFMEHEMRLGEACEKSAESVVYVYNVAVKGALLQLWEKRQSDVRAHMNSFTAVLRLIVTRMQRWMRDVLRGDGIDATWTEMICDRMGGDLYRTVRSVRCEDGSKEICERVCEVLREICERFERKERGIEAMGCESFCRAYEMVACLGRSFGRAVTMMPVERVLTLGRHVRVFAERVAEKQLDAEADGK